MILNYTIEYLYVFFCCKREYVLPLILNTIV